MSSPDYYPDSNGLVVMQHSEDPFLMYCLTSSFILFCVFLLFTYFKDGILRTLSCIGMAFIVFLFTLHTFSRYFLDYIPYGKNLGSYNPRTSIFQQPRTRKAFIQIPPPPDEFLTEVKEQLIIFSSTGQISSIQDIQQESSDSRVFEAEQL